MSEEDRIANLVSAIWAQHPFWPSTFGPCANDGCQEYSRGGRECKGCLKKQLSALTSEEFATEFFQVLADVRECERKLVYGKHQTNNEKR